MVALSSRNYLLSKKNLILAGKIVRKLIIVKKKIKMKKNKNKYLLTVKDDFQREFKIKIDYLELRNINNLKLSTLSLKNASCNFVISLATNNFRPK